MTHGLAQQCAPERNYHGQTGQIPTPDIGDIPRLLDEIEVVSKSLCEEMQMLQGKLASILPSPCDSGAKPREAGRTPMSDRLLGIRDTIEGMARFASQLRNTIAL